MRLQTEACNDQTHHFFFLLEKKKKAFPLLFKAHISNHFQRLRRTFSLSLIPGQDFELNKAFEWLMLAQRELHKTGSYCYKT